MRKILIFILFSVSLMNMFVVANANAVGRLDKNTVVKNKLFSITIPVKLKGTYTVKKEKDKISIYH
ncbi:hypothetical protein IJ707_03985, partial [bacterium]|nr:hypothetical protein [bacterium]